MLGSNLFLFLFGLWVVNSAAEVQKKQKVLCFNTHTVDERGTDVATFDYADFAEKIYGYTSKIIMPDAPSSHNGKGLSKYMKRFVNNTAFYKADSVSVNGKMHHGVEGPSFPGECKRLGCDYVHVLKSGEKSSFPQYPQGFDARLVIIHHHSTDRCSCHHYCKALHYSHHITNYYDCHSNLSLSFLSLSLCVLPVWSVRVFKRFSIGTTMMTLSPMLPYLLTPRATCLVEWSYLILFALRVMTFTP